jgi:hypothetical protein
VIDEAMPQDLRQRADQIEAALKGLTLRHTCITLVATIQMIAARMPKQYRKEIMGFCVDMLLNGMQFVANLDEKSEDQ